MKTLIIWGAARKNGHTKQMVDTLNEHLAEKAELIDCYRLQQISPCMDCRYCWKEKGCCIKDGMQEIYKKIEEAECIIFAAPLYFHTVPSKMKKVIDRCQIHWAKAVRGDAAGYTEKIGAIMMVGGSPAFENQFLAGEIPLRGVLGDLGASCLDVIMMDNSDKDSLETRPEVKQQILALADKISHWNTV